MNMTQCHADGVKNIFVGFGLKQLEQERDRLFGETPVRDAQLPQNVGPERPFLRASVSQSWRGVEYVFRSAIVKY